jgi:hypothetical protein
LYENVQTSAEICRHAKTSENERKQVQTGIAGYLAGRPGRMMGIASRPITVCAGSGPVIRDIRNEDLHVRVVKKYQDLQKNMRKPGELAATVTATTTATDSVENAPSSAAVTPTTSRSTLQSRERGVSQSTVVTKRDLHVSHRNSRIMSTSSKIYWRHQSSQIRSIERLSRNH